MNASTFIRGQYGTYEIKNCNHPGIQLICENNKPTLKCDDPSNDIVWIRGTYSSYPTCKRCGKILSLNMQHGMMLDRR